MTQLFCRKKRYFSTTSMLRDRYFGFPPLHKKSQQSASRWRVLAFYRIAPCLKANFDELKGSLYSTKSQVDTLVTENIAVNSKLKLLEEQVLTLKKELEEVKQRLYDSEDSYDDLEQYTRKFNLVIHGIREEGGE